MPRKNRQKLHKALRLKAEAKKAEAAVRRRARKAEAARRAALTVRRRGQTLRLAGERVPVLQPAGVRHLLELAEVPPFIRRRVRQLYAAVRVPIPELWRLDALPFLLLLATHAPVRQLSVWVAPREASLEVRRTHLVRTLLTRFEVPAFLLNATDVAPACVARMPEENRWVFALIGHLGAGGSLRAAIRRGLLPTPLTRRMQHLFLQAGPDHTPLHALRAAQVGAFGGSPALARALLPTLLGQLWGPDRRMGEPWWQTVVHWLVRHEDAVLQMTPRARIAFIAGLRGLQAEAREHGRTLKLKGRTPTHLLPAIAALQERQRAAASPHAFPDPGFRGGPVPHASGEWTVEPLPTPVALVQEGQQMRHCVGAYVDLAKAGKVSLWSMRRNGKPVLTIEVVPATGRVVQVRGKANRKPEPWESRLVHAWAAPRGLKVA